MLTTHLVIRADIAALEQGLEGLEAVSMDLPVEVLLDAVADDRVIAQAVVARMIVCRWVRPVRRGP